MSTPETPAPTPAPAPAPAAKRQSVARRVLFGLTAAVTSPTAVKQERSLAAFVIGRVLFAAGASFGVEQLIVKVIGG